MKELIGELRQEHAVILATLDEIDNAITSGGKPDVPAYIAFFETYVEHRHHAKEEGRLFERMREDPFLSEVVGTLVDEHNEARDLLARMHTAPDAAALLSRYSANLRAHIAKEDGMIFESALSR